MPEEINPIEENNTIESNKTEEHKPKETNLKHALCYIPFFAFVLFFLETNKTPALLKHIKYGAILLIVYILLNMVAFWFLGGIFALVYIMASVYLGYKAYNGEDVDIEYIDKLEDKVKEGFETKQK